MTLANLITRLQKRDKDGPFRTQDANVAEYRNKGKVKARFQKFEVKLIQKAPSNFKRQAQPPMKNNFGGRCGNCGKMRRKSSERCRKAMGENQSNLTEADLCDVVTEAHMVEENPKTWWYDTCATTHICTDRDMFSTYQKCKSEDHVKMGNISQSKIKGTGKVVLKMTSGMEIILTNVKHVPNMRKNLIFGSLMSTHSFGIHFESDQLILGKNRVFI